MTHYPCDVDGCPENANVHGSGGIKYCRGHYGELQLWSRALAAEELAKFGGPIPQTCPRRTEEFGPWERDALNEDAWHILDQTCGEYLLTCSFCGSLHPDTFMQKAREGWEVGPTDKNYKAYLRRGEKDSDQGKFYFQHLSVEQRHEFIDMLNAGTMTIGYPGSFYRLPFFCRAS